MDKIYLKARAKINLTLNVLDKREDNYHNIESVFQKISLYDELYIEKNNENKLILKSNWKDLENDNNIISKTYNKLKNLYPTISGVTVTLIKHIPMQAGLGGGSTDCASFIKGLNKLFSLNLTESDLINIGKTLGADVVPCMYNLALAEGIGDIITPLSTKINFNALIIKPHFSCNTQEMYKKYDEHINSIKRTRVTSKVLDILKNNKPITLFHNLLYNAFEVVLKDDYEINMIKKEVLRLQGICPLLCGSGSCMFAIFPEEKDLEKAYTYFTKTFNYEVFKVRTMN